MRRAALLAVALLAWPGVALAQGENSPCLGADLLRGQQLLSQARVAYTRLLEQPNPPPCARQGFEATAQAQREAAALLQLGRDQEERKDPKAVEAYLQAIGKDRSLTAAVTALDALLAKNGSQTRPASAYAAAVALFDAGYRDAARQEAQRVLKERQPAEALPERLRGEQRSWVRRLPGTVSDWIKILTAVAVLVFLAFVLLVAFFWRVPFRGQRGRRLRQWRRRIPGVRWVFRTQVLIDDFESPKADSPVGKTLAALVGNEVQEAFPGGRALDRVASAEKAPGIPDLAEASPALKFLAPLVNRALKRDRLTISGRVHLATKEGVGLSLVITDRHGTAIDAKQFTGPTGPEPDAFLDLAPMAGAWAVYALHRARPRDEQEQLRLLGTTVWESYGYFRCGVRFHDRPASSAAAESYKRALAEDAANVGALINLGALDRLRPERYHLAIERLRRALRMLESDEASWRHGGAQINPTWYSTVYLLAVTYLHRYMQPGGSADPQDLRSGRLLAVRLVRTLGRTLLALQARTGSLTRDAHPFSRLSDEERDELESLAHLLGSTEQRAVSLLASMQAAVAKSPQAGLGVHEAMALPGGTDKERWEWLAAIDSDDPPDGSTLVTVAALETTLSAPAQYNLACYYVRSGQLDQALEALALALEYEPKNVEWAKERDPALAPLRSDPAFQGEFRRLIARFEPAAGPPVEVPADWTVEIAVPGR